MKKQDLRGVCMKMQAGREDKYKNETIENKNKKCGPFLLGEGELNILLVVFFNESSLFIGHLMGKRKQLELPPSL